MAGPRERHSPQAWNRAPHGWCWWCPPSWRQSLLPRQAGLAAPTSPAPGGRCPCPCCARSLWHCDAASWVPEGTQGQVKGRRVGAIHACCVRQRRRGLNRCIFDQCPSRPRVELWQKAGTEIWGAGRTREEPFDEVQPITPVSEAPVLYHSVYMCTNAKCAAEPHGIAPGTLLWARLFAALAARRSARWHMASRLRHEHARPEADLLRSCAQQAAAATWSDHTQEGPGEQLQMRSRATGSSRQSAQAESDCCSCSCSAAGAACAQSLRSREYAGGAACVRARHLATRADLDCRRSQLSDEEWGRRLSRQQFKVLRKAGTELPFTSKLNSEKRAGTFRHACMSLHLLLAATAAC